MSKIASLLPSATELCAAIGLQDDLIAISHECDFPVDLDGLSRITSSIIPPNLSQLEIDQFVRSAVREGRSLYSVDERQLNELQPDLIVTQGLCSVCAVSEDTVSAVLRGNLCHLPNTTQVISLTGMSFDGICSDIRTLAKATNKEVLAEAHIAEAKRQWDSIAPQGNRSILLLEWIDPYFSAGHWVPEQIEAGGFRSAIGTSKENSRVLSALEIAECDVEGIGVVCCGFNLEQNVRFAQQLYDDPVLQGLSAIQNNNVWAFDANSYFSRPTLRICRGAELLNLAFDQAIGVEHQSQRVLKTC